MSDATLGRAPAAARAFRPATQETPWVRWTLIVIAVAGLGILVAAPLIVVFAEALGEGWAAVIESLGHRDARDVDDVRAVQLGDRGGLVGAFDQPFDEAVVQAALDEDARAVRADLAGGIEVAEDRATDRVLDVGIVEDQDRRLAAKLHRHMLHVPGGGRIDLLAGGHRAGQ